MAFSLLDLSKVVLEADIYLVREHNNHIQPCLDSGHLEVFEQPQSTANESEAAILGNYFSRPELENKILFLLNRSNIGLNLPIPSQAYVLTALVEIWTWTDSCF